MKYALLIVLLMAGCGRETAVNPDLKASVERYLQHAPNHGHIDELVSVDWGEPPGTALGQCEVKPELGGGHSRKVRIRKRGDDQAIVDTLVAHELAHCLHDKVHDDTRIPMLMNTVLDENDGYWAANLDDEIKRTLGR